MRCEKRNQCGRWFAHEQPEYRKYDNVEDLSTFGWGSISMNYSKTEYACGELGHYRMFEPIGEIRLSAVAGRLNEINIL